MKKSDLLLFNEEDKTNDETNKGGTGSSKRDDNTASFGENKTILKYAANLFQNVMVKLKANDVAEEDGKST